MANLIFGRRQSDFDLAVGAFDELDDFEHRLARHDDARHAFRAGGTGILHLSEPVAVGGDGPDLGLGARLGLVQIDAVQIVTGFLGRDRQPGLVDEHLEIARRHDELVAQIARGEIGEILWRQCLQGEPRFAGQNRQPALPGLRAR